jgi:hypothetical protein
MARTAEQILKEMLGAQAFQIAVLTAQLEQAKEQAIKPSPGPEGKS